MTSAPPLPAGKHTIEHHHCPQQARMIFLQMVIAAALESAECYVRLLQSALKCVKQLRETRAAERSETRQCSCENIGATNELQVK
jgi:hypothetical protein